MSADLSPPPGHRAMSFTFDERDLFAASRLLREALNGLTSTNPLLPLAALEYALGVEFALQGATPHLDAPMRLALPTFLVGYGRAAQFKQATGRQPAGGGLQ